MRPLAKASIVLGLLLAALAAAYVTVVIYIAATAGPDRQTSAGMYDFGDMLLFLAVFAVAAIPAMAVALYFLRPYPRVWTVLSVGAILVAATAVAASIEYLLGRPGAGVAVLRILVAPGFAILFFVSGIVAPRRSARIVFFATTAAEVIAFASVAMIWFRGRG